MVYSVCLNIGTMSESYKNLNYCRHAVQHSIHLHIQSEITAVHGFGIKLSEKVTEISDEPMGGC